MDTNPAAAEPKPGLLTLSLEVADADDDAEERNAFMFGHQQRLTWLLTIPP